MSKITTMTKKQQELNMIYLWVKILLSKNCIVSPTGIYCNYLPNSSSWEEPTRSIDFTKVLHSLSPHDSAACHLATMKKTVCKHNSANWNTRNPVKAKSVSRKDMPAPWNYFPFCPSLKWLLPEFSAAVVFLSISDLKIVACSLSWHFRLSKS